MDLLDELRLALKGLIQDGTVVHIRRAADLSKEGNGGLQSLPVFVVYVDAPDPMVHLQAIIRAVHAAGLMNALHIEVQRVWGA
jgi:hypothetical protein